MISLAALLLGSCTSTEVNAKFDQNATERLSGHQKELNDLLLSSSEGWKAVYYTDSTQLGGWTHLFKFLPEGNVDMASDFDGDTSAKRSQYEIQLGSTVSLVFTSQNRIHLLSDAGNYPTKALLAKGYLGDFQFYYYGQKNGDIIFKTNRNGHELRFVKATAQDWIDLSKNTPIIDKIKGDMASPLFRLLEINDGTTARQFQFHYNTDARFGTASSLDPASRDQYDVGFAFTPTSAVSKLPVDVKGQKLTNFIYDSVTNNFVARGTKGVSATIKFTNIPPVLTDDYKVLLAGNPEVKFGYYEEYLEEASTNSDYFKKLLDKANGTLSATKKINNITLYFNSTSGSKKVNKIEYNFNGGGKKNIVHYVSTTEDAVNKTIVLKDSLWSVSAKEYAFIKELDAELTNPKGLYLKKENFKIRYTNVIYTFTNSSFRFTTYKL